MPRTRRPSPLDTVVVAFEEGKTPEDIAQQYPSLALGDIYAVIAYYLERLSDVRSYLAERDKAAQRLRAENERRDSPAAAGVRDRLLRRRSNAESSDP
jgi:hypothetical protein